MQRRYFLASFATIALLSACATQPPKNIPTLQIAQIDRGVQIVLPNVVLYETGKAALNAEASAPYLDRVAKLLKEKTNKAVAVEGHTDNIGSPASNQKLSEARAASVQEALLARGVPADRLKVAGFSFTKPVGDNKTEEGRAVNRRCEIIILDEKVENITKGEPEGSFSAAFANLKTMVDQGLTPTQPAK